MTAIYLNAASHGLPNRSVLRRMISHLDLEAMVGPVAAVGQVRDELANVRGAAATLFNADPAHVGFDTGTLNAWRAYVYGMRITGKRLLVAPHEWGENIAVLNNLASNAGAEVEILPPLDLSAPDLDTWQERIDDDVGAIFLPMVTSVAGLRYPVEAIGALQRPDQTEIIVDAAQAIGQIDIDVTRLGCTALFATTRKWVCGPRQSAVFWTADPMRRVQTERLDTHVALRLGLGIAINRLLDRTVSKTTEALRERSDQIRAYARDLGLTCLSAPENGTTAVTLAVPEAKAAKVAAALEMADVTVKWPGAEKDEPCSDIDTSERRLLRIAPHLDISADHIDLAFEAIAGAIK